LGWGTTRLRRAAGWSFLPAALFTSLVFGALHWNYGSVFVVLVTAAGGFWYAWLLERWESLVLVMTLHGLMDLAFTAFHGGQNATGDLWLNIGRTGTIALSVVLTVRFRRRHSWSAVAG